jgi:hypothetical protein
MNKNKKLQQYLIPKTLDLNKENPLGIILAFKKEIMIKSELIVSASQRFSSEVEFDRNQKFSVLIFFSFISGRVERYLMNHSKILLDYSQFLSKNELEFNSYDKSFFIFENEKYFINHSEDYEIENLEFTSFNYLNDGNLNSKFFNIFIWELTRDYLFNFLRNEKVSYLNPNMDTIRKLTSYQNILTVPNTDLKIPVGTGKIEEPEKLLINIDNKYKLKDYTSFDANHFLSFDSSKKNLPFVLYVPKLFEKMNISRRSTKLNEGKFLKIKTKTLLKKDYPQCLLDLKRSLEFKNIQNINDLSARIKNFNYHTDKRLNNLINSRFIF